MMKQILLTVEMGKRLIGKALAAHPAVISALQKGTVVIVAGTTNSYVARRNTGVNRAERQICPPTVFPRGCRGYRFKAVLMAAGLTGDAQLGMPNLGLATASEIINCG